MTRRGSSENMMAQHGFAIAASPFRRRIGRAKLFTYNFRPVSGWTPTIAVDVFTSSS